MECDICFRVLTSNLPIHCITCARNVLYEPGLHHTRVLLEKESLARKIENAISAHPQESDRQDKKTENEAIALSQAWSREAAKARKVESEENTGKMQKHILVLREEIKGAKDEISQRKARLEKRKTEYKSIRTCLPARRTAVTNNFADSIKKGSQSWLGLHNKASDTRAFLCREAALLYRLRQKKKARGGVVLDQYSIGGLPVVNLKEINSTSITSRQFFF